MKVGIYDPYLDDLGGGEKYMMTIASCLSKKHEVTVFWDKKEDVEAIEKRFSLNLSDVKLLPNIFLPKVSVLKRFRMTRKFDAFILLTDGSIPFIGAKKLFLHIQQPLENMHIYSFFDKIKLHRVTAFFCNSFYTKSLIEKKFEITTRVIYPPVTIFPNKHTVSDSQRKKENIILHVGRFRSVHGEDYKKQNFMIDTFKKMFDKGFKNWQFVLAVSVHEKDMAIFKEMQKKAEGYPITFLINEPNDALWDIYAKAKIYWHASGFGEDLEKYPELAEHFGITTVEAMGAGVVPIVINAGGQKEIVQDGENGVLWNTERELEDKTILLSRDIKFWKMLSKNAMHAAEKFNENTFCAEINALIQ